MKRERTEIFVTSHQEPFVVNGFFYCLRALLFVMGLREPPGMAMARNTLNCALTNPGMVAGGLWNIYKAG